MVEIKQLQLLRSKEAYANFAAAKTKLTEKLGEDTVKDGEIITASYVKGSSVHTLFAIKRKGATGTVADGESYFQDVEATAEEIQAAVKKITEGEGEGAVSLNSLKAAIEANTTAINKLNGGDTVDGSVAKSVKDAIEVLDITDTAVDGQFVTAVSETDGKVVISRGEVASNMVTAVAVAASTETVAIDGTNVDTQIKNLGKAIKTVEGNAAKYEVVKLTNDEVTALADGANVREAYKVVSYTGDFATATDKKQVGEIIKIYKDAALLSVTPDDGVAGENTVIKFKYSLANGTEKEVSIDLGKAIFESEMGNGMQIDGDKKIAIKLDANNESEFLTVGADGLKLAGVQDAIDAAVGALDVTDPEVAGKYVSAVSETDGKITVARKDLNAEAVALAEIKEADGVENPASLGAENNTVQKGIQALFDEMLKNEKVSAAAKAALITVLGSHAVNGDTFKVEYTGDGFDIIKGAQSFSDADERLAAAIATLSATKVIDCGTY